MSLRFLSWTQRDFDPLVCPSWRLDRSARYSALGFTEKFVCNNLLIQIEPQWERSRRAAGHRNRATKGPIWPQCGELWRICQERSAGQAIGSRSLRPRKNSTFFPENAWRPLRWQRSVAPAPSVKGLGLDARVFFLRRSGAKKLKKGRRPRFAHFFGANFPRVRDGDPICAHRFARKTKSISPAESFFEFFLFF